MRRVLLILLIILAPLAVFAAMIQVDRAYGLPGKGRDYVLKVLLPPGGTALNLPKVEGPLDASRPLVVIDAGHGGHDPGAGAGALKEKALTLELAMALRDQLLAQGGVRVALTRSDDRFLMLAERTDIARQLKADLFLSIHADSAEIGNASGASVYVLSEKGSSEAASKMATRENQADAINGVQIAGTSPAVSAILVDLSQRDTQARSEQFANMILREARGTFHFRDSALQSAAFGVLKSPDVPSALFEAGYISNGADAGRLASTAGREAFAKATAQAIRVYFARQTVGQADGG